MDTILKLVEKQIKDNFLKRKLSGFIKEPDFRPCITISRENGSGGHIIAQMTAKKLGFKFYDEELIDMIAKKTHLKRELIQSVDEKALSSIEAIINTFLGFEPLHEQEYIRGLIRVILAIAHKGKAVILGRGGNFIVPAKDTLSVRVVAPFRVRVQNAMKFEYPHRSVDFIKEKLLETHLERKNFVKKYFNKDISNCNYYDLVLNTHHMSIKQAADIVLAAFKEKFGKS